MFRLSITIILLCLLSACAIVRQADSRKLQSEFDARKGQLEQKAQAGEITWVQAVTQTREMDKSFAHRTDLYTNWKYDQDDEEYHAYCLVLAERLDQKQISFAEFDSERITRFNAIQARRQSLYAQQQMIQNTQSQQYSRGSISGGSACFFKSEWTSGFNTNCVYSCVGGEAVQTISSTSICPLSIVR